MNGIGRKVGEQEPITLAAVSCCCWCIWSNLFFLLFLFFYYFFFPFSFSYFFFFLSWEDDFRSIHSRDSRAQNEYYEIRVKAYAQYIDPCLYTVYMLRLNDILNGKNRSNDQYRSFLSLSSSFLFFFC